MAMRTEQYGNLFAKLNNGNLSDCGLRNRRSGGERRAMEGGVGRAKRRSPAGTLLLHFLAAGRVNRQAD